MTTVIMFIKALPAPLIVGWICVAIWAITQVVWYRRAHIEAPAVLPAAAPAARRIPPRRRPVAAEAHPAEPADPAGAIVASGSVLGLS